MAFFIRRRSFLAAAAGSLFGRPMAALAQDTQIVGAGSSFVKPVMRRWIETLPATLGVKADFASVGTGAAHSKILAGDLDFAVVELPLTAEQVAAGNMIQFPLALGALVCVVNLAGIAADRLKLTPVLLGGIYSGEIKKWDDPRILAANPGLALPDLEIRPLRLDTPDNSVFSTTATFSQYLLTTNPGWQKKFGETVPKRWAVGSMTASAELLVETLKVLPGGIGYVPLGTAAGQKLTTVKMVNKAGKAVSANIDSLRAAAGQVDWAKAPGMVATALDLPGDTTWPIVLTSYAIVQGIPPDKDRGAAVREFFRHVVTNGAGPAAEVFAAATPPALRAAILDRLGGIKV